MLVWLSVWSQMQIISIWSSWCHPKTKTPSSLATFKFRLVLPFWYRLTQVVLEKNPLSISSSYCLWSDKGFWGLLHTHPFNGSFSRTTRVGRYQKGKINLDFTEARDSEWQWHQLGHMQVCTSLQTDNYATTSPLSFLQAGCPSCRPTNSVKTLKAYFEAY